MNPTLSGVVAVSMWASIALFFVYIRHLPTFELAAILFFIGFLTMTAKQLINSEDILSYWRRPLKDYAFWIGGAGLYTLLMFYAFGQVDVFEANILNYLWPILLVLFSVLFHREALSPVVALGMVLGFLGVFALFLPEGGHGFFGDFQLGHAIALVGACVWAAYSSAARGKAYPTGFLAAAFFVFSMICAGLHFLFEETVMPDPTTWIFIVISGISRISYAFWDYGMKHGNVIFLASLSYFLPLISSILLTIFGFGPQQPFIALGAVMIIIACLCVNAGHLKHMLKNIKVRV